MGGQEINAFLTHLAVNEQVSASTQNHALAALLFLYKRVWIRQWVFPQATRWRNRDTDEQGRQSI